MAKEKKASQKKHINNSRYHDSSSKLIFGNAELCSQFLRNYMDIPLLKNVKAEDIEDVTERYVPMFTEERNSDTVKRIRLSEKDTLFFVSLIEHKTRVDYNVSMQLLRYMVYIWEDYEKEMEKKKKGNKLVQLNDYSVGELVEKKDELSLLMLINRLQSIAAFRELNLPKDYLKDLSENSTDELLDIIARVTASMLRHLHLPEEEVAEFTDQVKERDMAVLFEYFEDVDLPAERKRAREEGLAEGLAEGRTEGIEIGQERLSQLAKALFEQKRLEDLERAMYDPEYREELYREFHI